MFTTGKGSEQETKTYVTSNQEGVKDEDLLRYNSIIDVLLAAGYFRVRIATLSPFDKVIGGTCWCISNSNVDVDVDVSFQEDANIGQKIKVSEKVISALKRMKCPHKIQSFQIQGLDFAAIYEVLQWLVKKVFETREENRERIKRYSELVFTRSYELPQDAEQTTKFQKALPYIESVKNIYKPQRKFKRSRTGQYSEWGLVQSVLLEYGHEYKTPEKEQQEKPQGKTAQLGAAVASQLGTTTTSQQQQQQQGVSGPDVNELKKDLTDSTDLSATNINKIFTLHSDLMRKENEFYQKASEGLQGKQLGEDALHNIKVAQLKKEVETLKKQFKENKEQYDTIKGNMDTVNEELQKYRDYNERLEEKIAQIAERIGGDIDKDALARIQQLVAINESLKKQEVDFRNSCRTEMIELKDQLSKLESASSLDSSDIQSAYEADLKRMKQIKKLLAMKNREIAIAQRKLDEIPSRPELVQYERRFTELYAQIALQFDETRKYYDTYNTLSETKKYLDKENSLLNSVAEYFQKSLTSKAKDYKPWMVSNMEKTVDAVKKSKDHVEKKLNEEKEKKEDRNGVYQQLVTIKRNYYRAVKELENEYKRNEELRKKAKQILEARKSE